MNNKTDNIPDILFHNAQGFYAIGISCALTVTKEKGLIGFQRIAPAAVNLSFAVELLFKGLLLLTTKSPAKGHNLLQLYKLVPEAIKVQIDLRYQKFQLQNKDNKELTSIKMTVRKASDKTEEIKDDGEPTLLILLKTHSKSFENWRYMHEIGQVGYDYDMNFKAIDCLIKALMETIDETPQKKRLHLKKVQ